MGRVDRLFFTVIIFSLGVGCHSTPQPKKETDSTAMSKGHEPSDLRMTGMHVQSYEQAGLDWEVIAPYGEVFSKRNLMRLKSLAVQLFDAGQKSTDISAEQGIMYSNTMLGPPKENTQTFWGVDLEPGDMFLVGNVVMVSTDGTKMSTDWAHYHKKTDLITSTAPVKVLRADSITYGVGMEATADLSSVHIFNETLVIPD
ncbi:MAG: Lipopolysaccharide export system protein LptC [Elusimicrobia bacterium]|nr:Lipopolysaccharide export system protein LptC [Elusimicrobiota bacterium]